MGRFASDYWPEVAAALVLLAVVGLTPLRSKVRALADWYFRHVPLRVSTGITAIAAITAVAIPFVFDALENPARVHVAAILILVQATATGLPLFQQAKLNDLASEAAQAATRDITRSLVPLAGLVKEITELRANAAAKGQLRGRAHVVALTAAATLLGGPDDVRASWYAAEGAAPRRRLVPPAASSVGRPDMASMIFDEQTTLGATVLTALDKRDVVYCRDISEEPPAGWVERPTKWRSFLSAPVIYEEQLLGMLTVDSPVADDFDLDRDAGMVFTLAHLLATALKA